MRVGGTGERRGGGPRHPRQKSPDRNRNDEYKLSVVARSPQDRRASLPGRASVSPARGGRSSPRDQEICCHEQAVELLPLCELRNEEMNILDDDIGHDLLQTLTVGHARADVQGDGPEAALEALREGPPSGARLPDVRADRDIEPPRS